PPGSTLQPLRKRACPLHNVNQQSAVQVGFGGHNGSVAMFSATIYSFACKMIITRSVVFIIVTSAGLPEEPVPRRRSVLFDFTCLLDLRATLAITSRQGLADLVDEHRRQRACSAHAVFFRFGDSLWNFRERQVVQHAANSLPSFD